MKKQIESFNQFAKNKVNENIGKKLMYMPKGAELQMVIMYNPETGDMAMNIGTLLTNDIHGYEDAAADGEEVYIIKVDDAASIYFNPETGFNFQDVDVIMSTEDFL